MLPVSSPAWSLSESARKVKEHVDRLRSECAKAKSELGTSYDTLLAIPAYCFAFDALIEQINNMGYTINELGPTIVTEFRSTQSWAEIAPAYITFKQSLSPLSTAIRSHQTILGATLVIEQNGTRVHKTNAGTEVNNQLTVLLDAVLANFG